MATLTLSYGISICPEEHDENFLDTLIATLNEAKRIAAIATECGASFALATSEDLDMVVDVKTTLPVMAVTPFIERALRAGIAAMQVSCEGLLTDDEISAMDTLEATYPQLDWNC